MIPLDFEEILSTLSSYPHSSLPLGRFLRDLSTSSTGWSRNREPVKNEQSATFMDLPAGTNSVLSCHVKSRAVAVFVARPAAFAHHVSC